MHAGGKHMSPPALVTEPGPGRIATGQPGFYGYAFCRNTDYRGRREKPVLRLFMGRSAAFQNPKQAYKIEHGDQGQ